MPLAQKPEFNVWNLLFFSITSQIASKILLLTYQLLRTSTTQNTNIRNEPDFKVNLNIMYLLFKTAAERWLSVFLQ